MLCAEHWASVVWLPIKFNISNSTAIEAASATHTYCSTINSVIYHNFHYCGGIWCIWQKRLKFLRKAILPMEFFFSFSRSSLKKNFPSFCSFTTTLVWYGGWLSEWRRKKIPKKKLQTTRTCAAAFLHQKKSFEKIYTLGKKRERKRSFRKSAIKCIRCFFVPHMCVHIYTCRVFMSVLINFFFAQPKKIFFCCCSKKNKK